MILIYAFLWQSWVALERENSEPILATTVQQVSVRGDFKLPAFLENDTANMPIYASLCKPLCLLLAKLYFQKYFIALSDNTRTSSSRRESRMLCLYCSWLWARRMCAFHSLTFSSATSPLCRSPSSSLLFILEEYFPMAEWISWIASFSALQS